MKPVVKYPFVLVALLSTCLLTQITEARLRQIVFDDAFFVDDSWLEDLMDWRNATNQLLKQNCMNYGPSKEDREAIKFAREKLGKVKFTVTEDDQKVTVQFTGFEALENKDIKVIRKDQGWLGTITLPVGKVEFFIAQNGIQVARTIEMKKEDKDKKEHVRYSSSLPADLEYFKQFIDIGSLKAAPFKDKDTTLTLVAQKQKEEVLLIPKA